MAEERGGADGEEDDDDSFRYLLRYNCLVIRATFPAASQNWVAS